MTPTFRSPLVIPILAYGQPDQGYTTARVTSPFGQRGAYFHGGLDIGNERLGDTVVAVADGVVEAVGNLGWPWSEPTTQFPSGNFGGLMVVIRHGEAFSIYAHMRMTTVARGQSVKAGTKVGEIGDTGSAAPPPLGGGGHLHFGIQADIDLVPDGLAWVSTYLGIGLDVDPWPLITGQMALGDDVNLPGGLKHIVQGVVGQGNRLRRDPNTTEGSRVLEGTIFVQVYGRGVKGQPYTLGAASGDTYAWVGAFGETWFVADPLVTGLTLTDTGKTSMQIPTATDPAVIAAAVKAATDPLIAKLDRARPAAEALVEALR